MKTNSICPRCGSSSIKFSTKHAGTVSESKYYRTGVKNSWILPAGRKTYRSDKIYKTVCLCQKCGYSWDWVDPLTSAVLRGFGITLYAIVYILIIREAVLFSTHRFRYVILSLLMTAIAGAWISKKRVVIDLIKSHFGQKEIDSAENENTSIENADASMMDWQPPAPPSATELKIIHTPPTNAELDELIIDAARIVVQVGQASTSMLQRRLGVGYSRASRIADQLEEQGIIGPYAGSTPRKVLITAEQFENEVIKKL